MRLLNNAELAASSYLYSLGTAIKFQTACTCIHSCAHIHNEGVCVCAVFVFMACAMMLGGHGLVGWLQVAGFKAEEGS